MPRTPPPAIGEPFDRLTVSGESFMIGTRRYIPCDCKCGQSVTVLVANLRSGKTKSCGCWKRERTATIVSETRWKNSHGRASGDKDELYRLWLRINRRCYNPNADNYRWYGGRGIGMWEPWRNDAGLFIDWIEQNLGPRPSLQHSINRVDNDGDYKPGNLDWQDPIGQARNRRPRRRASA